MGSRSTNGCWTCRLRKKKCDERRPICERCAELSVSCHGYGPRPHWMDRGPLQKEAAHRMKSIVSRKRSSPQDPEPAPHKPSRSGSDSGYGTSPSLPDQKALKSPNLEHEFMIDDLDIDIPTFNEEDTRGNNSYDNQAWNAGFLAAPVSANFDSLANIALLPDPLLFSPTSTIPLAQPQLDPMIIDSLTRDTGNIDVAAAMARFQQTGVNQLWPDMTTPVQQDCFNMSARQSISTPQTSFHKQRYSSSGLTSPVNGQIPAIVDDDLLMDYLDRVFYIYCPFYTSKQQQSRGWLLSALRREGASYHAALALTELHRPKRLLTNEQGSHHRLALQEVQEGLARLGTIAGGASSVDRIGLLIALLHLLFYELSLGGKRNWQMHLSTSAILLSQAVQELVSDTTKTFDKLRPNKTEASSGTEIAMGFLLSFFVCIDVIGSASTRSSPVLTLDHKLVLETCDADPVNLTGCDAMVMICILDITSLDNWKQEMSKANELSLVELANRGRCIEKRLRGRLANIEAELSRGYTELTGITRIYALAAIIYLHVVISGAHPKIPEIAESVSKTIDALQGLSDAKLLRSVVWPFCVSGCLATSNQEHHYRNFVSPSYMKDPQFATCLESFEIMKECWQSRKTASGSYDWAFIMQKRQKFILLG